MTIALYDSGLGGLSVLRSVQRCLPDHALVYLADSAFCPYGTRSDNEIRQRALRCTQWLQHSGAAVVVIACNTATSAALEFLRSQLSIPIVGMEPGLKPAVAATQTGRIGVLATAGTLSGRRFSTLVYRFAATVEIVTVPCPELVTQVEAGQIDTPATRTLLDSYLAPLREQAVDTIVLGCTHFLFLRSLVAELAGPKVRIIDTGPAVAAQVSRVVQSLSLASSSGAIHCYTTGSVAAVAPALQQIWGHPLPLEHVEC